MPRQAGRLPFQRQRLSRSVTMIVLFVPVGNGESFALGTLAEECRPRF